MSKIRPPRKPRGENKSVTIAAQDAQIRMLIGRVEELAKDRDSYVSIAMKHQGHIYELSDKIAGLQRELSLITRMKDESRVVINRMEGWRDCAREIFVGIELPVGSS